jgi:hypothetical protein
MKTAIILIMLLFTFFTCAAPELSSELKKVEKQNSMNWLIERTRDREFVRFIEHLRFKESSGDWTRVNEKGCIGWFQFSETTMKFLGQRITTKAFMQDPGIFPPEDQVKLLKVLLKSNSIQLQDYMAFIGKTINGVTITKAGILAGAHLGGAMGVEMYLSSGGNINFCDAFNTKISDYFREFQGYDI